MHPQLCPPPHPHPPSLPPPMAPVPTYPLPQKQDFATLQVPSPPNSTLHHSYPLARKTAFFEHLPPPPPRPPCPPSSPPPFTFFKNEHSFISDHCQHTPQARPFPKTTPAPPSPPLFSSTTKATVCLDIVNTQQKLQGNSINTVPAVAFQCCGYYILHVELHIVLTVSSSVAVKQ